jgi:phosphoribosylglycinamide formyltransferase-1
VSRTRVGVLVSGRGSNLQALLDAAREPDFPAEIVVVLSNIPGAAALDRAKAAGVAGEVVPHRGFATRPDFERKVTALLEDHGVELVCQAGFMRVVTGEFVDRWRDRLLNIHPSLLPAFPGLDTHTRALRAGVALHGCSVHFVRETVDEGPIVGQAAVPVLPGDDAEALAARVLAAEHRLYPLCLGLVASGRARVEGETVIYSGVTGAQGILLNPAGL